MLPSFDSITDPVAVDRWRCKRDGRTFTASVQVGRPVPAEDDPNGDWCCPVFVETFTDRVITVMGVGPVDAMMNAILLIRQFADTLEEWTPRADDPVLPPPDEILRRLRTGDLLAPSRLANMDCSAILDARDTDTAFEREWLQAYETLKRKWEAVRRDAAVVEDVRREAFLVASRATGQHELASYVSDDFELIAWAASLGETPPLVERLWLSYAAGELP